MIGAARWMAALAVAGAAAGPACAALVDVTGPLSSLGTAALISPAPAEVLDGSVTTTGMVGFDEVQDLVLTAALAVDGGVIGPGLRISSHMIFLNAEDGGIRHGTRRNPVLWTFDGAVLGVMSDVGGLLEAASTPLLGAPGTLYPATGFESRGFERRDGYRIVAPNQIAVRMQVTEPGDWIRVVTASPVPLPATALLLLGGLAGLGLLARRRRA